MTKSLNNQIIGEFVDNSKRGIKEDLKTIQEDTLQKLNEEKEALEKSLESLQNIRDFISEPEHILGSELTKHGEIAEVMEVNFRNSKDHLAHKTPSATFEGVGRTAPEDYLVDGLEYQSKFIQNANDSLRHVIHHLQTYPDFPEAGRYHIPKDQFFEIMEILRGEVPEGFTPATARTCRKLVHELEASSGHDFSELVQPSNFRYQEVQQHSLPDTLEKMEEECQQNANDQIDLIVKESSAQEEKCRALLEPSLEDAAEYGLLSAGIYTTASIGSRLYKHVKNGHNLTEFSIDDWKELGCGLENTASRGMIRGASIYSLISVASMPSPVAAGAVSISEGLYGLAKQYKKGEISSQDFINKTIAISMEGGACAVGAFLGQALIPIPLLGTLIGVSAIKLTIDNLDSKTKNLCPEIVELLRIEHDALTDKLENDMQAEIFKLREAYRRQCELIRTIVSSNSEASLETSASYCQESGVPENMIIHNIEDLEMFAK